MARRSPSLPCLVVGLALVTGCSHSASIRLKNGQTVDGEIVGGTATSILVRGDGDDEREIPSAVEREDVEHIHHPGTLTAILSGLFVVGGLAVMSYGIANQSGCEGDFCGMGHFFYTIPGAGVAAGAAGPMIWGTYAWSRSSSAAGSEDGWSLGRGDHATSSGVVSVPF